MAKIMELMNAVNKSSKVVIGGKGLVVEDPPRIPSNNFALDLACGGGIPEGRVILIYGLEAAMKTTLLLKLIAQYQQQYPDKVCVFFDIEGHLLPSWAQRFGVDWEKLVYIRPAAAEQVVDMVEGFIQAEDVGLIGLDSLAALMSRAELDRDTETANVGTQGLLINKLYRRMTHALNEASRTKINPTIVLINQIRYKMTSMGDPEVMPGGPSINKFMSSLTLRVTGWDEFANKKDKLPSFKKINVVIKKWKVPILQRVSEYRIALRDIPELNLKFGEAYDWNTVLSYLKKLELLKQPGAKGWVLDAKIGGIKTEWDTQDDLKDKYINDKEFGAKVRKIIIQQALLKGDPESETNVEEAP